MDIRRRQREGHLRDEAPLGARRQTQVSPVGFDDRLNDRQAQPRALLLAIGFRIAAIEAFGEARHVFFSNSGAEIGDDDCV